MTEEQKKQIFDNLKRNSIGNDKRSANKRYHKNLILKISLASIMITFLSACSTGISKEVNLNNEAIMEENISKEYSGFSKDEVELAEVSNVTYLLKNRNMLDNFNYTEDGYEASYTKEVYARINELDDSNLHGFYLFATKDTFNTILNSQGYKDINDFLITKGYIDNNGKPSLEMWEESSLEEMGKYMEESTIERKDR